MAALDLYRDLFPDADMGPENVFNVFYKKEELRAFQGPLVVHLWNRWKYPCVRQMEHNCEYGLNVL